MMAEELPTAVDTLSRALARERVQSARHINPVRVCGVSGFFALFIVLGGVLRLPGWTGNLGFFTAYWLVAAALFWAGRHGSGGARLAGLAIALEWFLRHARRPLLTKPLALALTPLLRSAAPRLRS